MSGSAGLSGPDFGKGISASDLPDGGTLLGHAEGEAVLLVRRGHEVFAIGATCTHYGGPLASGIIVDDTVRCPWHHASFSLRTGEAVRAPALNPVPCWMVERRGDRLFVLGKRQASVIAPAVSTGASSIVIVGGGAAGDAAAEMLRREGYAGRITIISADASPPCDRPNLSKDYLAGTAPEEWIPLRPSGFFEQNEIELVLGARAKAIDLSARRVVLDSGGDYRFDRLLLATGANPIALSVPGANRPNVHYLRTLADSRALIAKLATVKRAAVVGSSFIGLEVAAALRSRSIDVSVVGLEKRPLERVLGTELGNYVQKLHEQHGVAFHLGQSVESIGDAGVILASGQALAADLVVVGIGVKPSLALAEQAGLTLDRGVVVDEYLQTSVPGIFAAGDIARWPDPHTGQKIRTEHWVVAQRQGQIAARNMLGKRERCAIVPFFWSQHYDTRINYVGHAEGWDRIEIRGAFDQHEFVAAYQHKGKTVALASVGRDVQNLEAELALEREDAQAPALLGG